MINFYDTVYEKAVAESLTAQQKQGPTAAGVLKVFHETVRTRPLKRIIRIHCVHFHVMQKTCNKTAFQSHIHLN